MPYLVMDWCHQSFRAKDSRGMRFSPEVLSFASTILNACDGSTFRLLSGPGNKYTRNFHSDQALHNLPLPSISTLHKLQSADMKTRDLNKSRICSEVLHDYGEMNSNLVDGIQVLAMDKTMINAGFCKQFEDCEADLGGVTGKTMDLCERLEMRQRRLAQLCLEGTTAESIQEHVIGLLKTDLDHINERKSTTERDYKKIRDKYVAKMISNNADTRRNVSNEVRFTPYQLYMAGVIEGCSQIQTQVPQLIDRLNNYISTATPSEDEQRSIQAELNVYNDLYYKTAIAELAEDAICVVAQDGQKHMPPAPVYIGFAHKSLCSKDGKDIFLAVTNEAWKRGVNFNVWSFDGEFACIYRYFYQDKPSTFIQEVKAINKTATSMEYRHLCTSISAYISGIFKFEPPISEHDIESECTLDHPDEYDGDDLSSLPIAPQQGIVHMDVAEMREIKQFVLQLRQNQAIWQVQKEKRLRCHTSKRPRATLKEMFCRFQIFCRRYGYEEVLSLAKHNEEGGETFTPWEMERRIADGLNDFDEHKIRFKFDEWLSNPVLSPITNKLLFFSPCINHLLKNVRHSIGSGKSQSSSTEAQIWHKAYSDIAKKNPAWMTQMEVDGTADPQSVDIMLKMFSDKAISLLKAEGHEATARMAEAMSGLHKAFDERGLKVSERIRLVQEGRRWLLEGIDWTSVSQKHVKGLSSVTFEGFIVAIDTHLQVQQYVRDKNHALDDRDYDFNSRTLCTDSVENLWSLIGHLNKKDFLRKFNQACIELSKKVDPNLPFVYEHSKKRIVLSKPHDREAFNARDGSDNDVEPHNSTQKNNRKRVYAKSGQWDEGLTGNMQRFRGLRSIAGCK
ncbi:hypothetical protein GUITHDRAFT_113559 [Guillardia theta CCMP2712]|uniref:Uncharacterized protein n=1 Tax=Guillardia theta (strain CCMP2712) TaxID=905079 RepID=L1IWV9_GUITC|nr:hypothetical protein GUITHDRAFT_113559 [Guillardia theta CCMP2712]EKX40320.1 hypothetical protein GUITHDRAFT_113559 [Guillardia theta CCMP2712]|eukprot:XP_005827300.1 hypothetical protein GUITHDRAFT_113559 [Guillardia theta CCMP2712]